jgi:alcohol dehydrogenase, propanol-preferring
MGSDIVIDFVNATKMVEVDMQILRRRAKVVLVGLFGGELRLSLVTMPTRAYKLIGSYTGNLTDLIELGTLSKKGLIRPDSFNRDQTTERCQVFRCREVTPRLFFIYAK